MDSGVELMVVDRWLFCRDQHVGLLSFRASLGTVGAEGGECLWTD